MTFRNLGLSTDLLRAVADQGYTEPTPIQQQAIPAILLRARHFRQCPNWNRQDGWLYPASTATPGHHQPQQGTSHAEGPDPHPHSRTGRSGQR
jgi:hypothetical protein